MKSKIFDINDIIVIISKMIEDRKNEELYGIEDDILDIPQYISDKIDMSKRREGKFYFQENEMDGK